MPESAEESIQREKRERYEQKKEQANTQLASCLSSGDKLGVAEALATLGRILMHMVRAHAWAGGPATRSLAAPLAAPLPVCYSHGRHID